MNNINDDIRNLLSRFDSTEKPTLKESDFNDMSDADDIQPSEDDGFIEDLTRGGYGASVDGKFIGNFDDIDDAVAAIRKEAGPNFFPSIWFVSDHGNVSLMKNDDFSETKGNVLESNINDDIRDMLSKLDSVDKSVLTESKGVKSRPKKKVQKESKSFTDYIGETERQKSAPVTGDILEMVVNEEVAIEIPVVNHDDSSYTLGTDGVAQRFISACDCQVDEAEYQGKDVELNQPMRGDVKKYKVYVTDPDTGNVKKVNFGSKEMEIKRDDPEARKSFRARHKCDQKTSKSDRDTAGYWSCKFWSSTPVSELLK